MKTDSLAERFFAQRELNDELGLPNTADEAGAKALWTWIENSPGWSTEDRYMPLENSYYRGQSDSSYGLSNSLYRTVRREKQGRIAEADLAAAERRTITTARGEGIGRNMTDGELLMVLQHHRMPTRLIDVSSSVKEALYFAVDSNDGVDGRLFILHPHVFHTQRLSSATDFVMDQAGEQTPSEQLDSWRAVPWSDAARGAMRASGEWTQTVALIDDPALDPRMRAQLGHFLVGGLIARYGGMSMTISEKPVDLDSWADITTLPINFPSARRNKTAHKSWPASGWTIRVKAAWKPYLRELLAQELQPINEDSMYPPVLEAKRLVLRSTAEPR